MTGMTLLLERGVNILNQEPFALEDLWSKGENGLSNSSAPTRTVFLGRCMQKRQRHIVVAVELLHQSIAYGAHVGISTLLTSVFLPIQWFHPSPHVSRLVRDVAPSMNGVRHYDSVT